MHSAKRLLDLPVEVFHAILREAIRVRGLKRAFRLRLINHFFAAEVTRLVHEYRLLDDCETPVRLLEDFGIDYLARRILRTDLALPIASPYVYIHRIAVRLALEDEPLNRHECHKRYVKLLCAKVVRVLEYSTMADIFAHPVSCPQLYYEGHFNELLLAAAAYTNKLAIIQELDIDLDRFCNAKVHELGHPFTCAIEGGHHAALDLLYSKTTGHHCRVCDQQDQFVFAIHQNPVDMSMAKRLFPSNRFDSYDVHMTLAAEDFLTSSVEIFELMVTKRKSIGAPDLNYKQLSFLIWEAMDRGWVDMTQHLLTRMPSPESPSNLLRWPRRAEAAPIIRTLFLEHGASFESRDIGYAAEKRLWDVVRILVARGADINGRDPIPRIMPPTPLVCAVAQERPVLVTELISLGARIDGEFGQEAVQRAKEDGLESMLAFLEQLGVEGVD